MTSSGVCIPSILSRVRFCNFAWVWLCHRSNSLAQILMMCFEMSCIWEILANNLISTLLYYFIPFVTIFTSSLRPRSYWVLVIIHHWRRWQLVVRIFSLSTKCIDVMFTLYIHKRETPKSIYLIHTKIIFTACKFVFLVYLFSWQWCQIATKAFMICYCYVIIMLFSF